VRLTHHCRVFLHLLVITAALGVAGCGDSAPPVHGEGQRAGAERGVRAGSLPPAPGMGHYEGTAAPTDESRGEKVGAVVPAQGGQKAQLEAREKERRAALAAEARERAEENRQTATPSQPPAASTTQQ